MSTDSFPSDPVSANALPAVVKQKRYHPVLVALHWLIAILILATFLLAQENEGDRERFRPGQGNVPQPESREAIHPKPLIPMKHHHKESHQVAFPNKEKLRTSFQALAST